jgi:hypothetical protein
MHLAIIFRMSVMGQVVLSSFWLWPAECTYFFELEAVVSGLKDVTVLDGPPRCSAAIVASVIGSKRFAICSLSETYSAALLPIDIHSPAQK